MARYRASLENKLSPRTWWRQQPRRSATRMHHPGRGRVEREGAARGAAEREREIERRHRFSQSPPVVRECIETIFRRCVSARCAFPIHPVDVEKEKKKKKRRPSRWILRARIHRSSEGITKRKKEKRKKIDIPLSSRGSSWWNLVRFRGMRGQRHDRRGDRES